MNEHDPRYRRKNFFGHQAPMGGTAPSRHDLAKHSYVAGKGWIDPLGRHVR